jgi:hypothetical protein
MTSSTQVIEAIRRHIEADAAKKPQTAKNLGIEAARLLEGYVSDRIAEADRSRRAASTRF